MWKGSSRLKFFDKKFDFKKDLTKNVSSLDERQIRKDSIHKSDT